jgi:peptidoglycan/xylan/chitin deacetylase (PgdA/CDA1 family)
MRYLYNHGFISISLDKYLGLIKNNSRPEQKFIVITFDDGFLDNYTEAFPILLKYSFTASIFLVSDCLGRIKNWGAQKGISLMTWEQAREMSRHGVSFQSHTRTHPDLLHLNREGATSELVDSKHYIEDKIGLPVNHFAYPYGRWNSRLIEWVEGAKYQAAYASGIAGTSPFSIERFECHESYWDFKIKASHLGSWLRNVYHWPRPRGSAPKTIYA